MISTIVLYKYFATPGTVVTSGSFTDISSMLRGGYSALIKSASDLYYLG